MEELKLPEINNEIKISQEEWDKFQKDLKITKFQLQQILDILEGRIRSTNITEYRNTYITNGYGIMDATHDYIMEFELIEEMTKLVECKVSFWKKDFISGVKI